MGPPPFDVVEVGVNDAGAVAAAMGPEGDLVEVRFARGCRCFAVRVEGALGGYGWLSTGPEWIGELQLEIRPRPKEGYVWNCVTLAEHRQRGIFRSLLIGIQKIAREEGLHRLWLGSVAIPAERALEPSGFTKALQFKVTKLAGLHVMTVSPAADRALAADARSVLGVGQGLLIRGSRRKRH